MAGDIEETRRTCCQEAKRKVSEERNITCGECGQDAGKSLSQVRWKENGSKVEATCI